MSKLNKNNTVKLQEHLNDDFLNLVFKYTVSKRFISSGDIDSSLYDWDKFKNFSKANNSFDFLHDILSDDRAREKFFSYKYDKNSNINKQIKINYFVGAKRLNDEEREQNELMESIFGNLLEKWADKCVNILQENPEEKIISKIKLI